MAIKTFTTGEVLTASDTNTYLANSGLVFVKSQTIGNAVSSVTVNDAFSATYDNYKIVIAGGTSTTQDFLAFRLGATTTSNYYGFLTYGTFAVATVYGANQNNSNQMTYAGGVDVNKIHLNLEVQSPFLAKMSGLSALCVIFGNNRGTAIYDHEIATSYTNFSLVCGSGTMTGGEITVYGYRKG